MPRMLESHATENKAVEAKRIIAVLNAVTLALALSPAASAAETSGRPITPLMRGLCS